MTIIKKILNPSTNLFIIVFIGFVAIALSVSIYVNSGPIQWMDNGIFLDALFTYHDMIADLVLQLKGKTNQLFTQNSDIQILPSSIHPSFVFITNLFRDVIGVQYVHWVNLPWIPLTCLLNYLIIRQITVNSSQILAAFFACAFIFVPNILWSISKFEVYFLHLNFYLITLLLLFKASDCVDEKYPSILLFFAGFFAGFALLNHQLTLILLIPLFWYLWQKKQLHFIPALSLGFIIGLFPIYEILPQINHPIEVFDLIRILITGEKISNGFKLAGFETSLLNFDFGTKALASMALLLLSFLGVQLVGLFYKSGSLKVRTIWWTIILNLIFALTYNINDRFSFAVVAANLLILLMANYYLSRKVNMKTFISMGLLMLQPLFIYLSIQIATNLNLLPSPPEKLSFRNDYHYFAVPFIADRSAENFAKFLDRKAPKGTLIFADYSPRGALQAAQATNLLQQATILDCNKYKTDMILPKCTIVARNAYHCRYIIDQLPDIIKVQYDVYTTCPEQFK